MPRKNEYRRNRKKFIKQAVEWGRKNPKKRRVICDTYLKNYPWTRHLFSINHRCYNKNNARYHRYGGRGIKNYLTIVTIKELWFEYKAHTLKHPSIDRIDNDGHYTVNNCRFIERNKNTPHTNCYGEPIRENKK